MLLFIYYVIHNYVEREHYTLKDFLQGKGLTSIGRVHQKVFFDKPSAERFKQFKSQCQHALNTVEKEAKNHRGWHKIDPVIRGFLGVLAALSVIGAIIVAATSKHGYSQTFFGKPETETSQKVTLFKQKYADHLEHVEEVVHSGMEPK